MIRKCLAQLAALPADPPLDEPRAFTVADLLTLIAGAAVGFGIALPRDGLDFSDDSFFGLPLQIFFFCASVLWSLALGTTLATLRRQIIYRRLAWPAEWPAIVLAAIPIVFNAPVPTNVANEIPLLASTPHFGALLLAIGGLTIVILFLGLLGRAHRSLPAWVSTLILLVAGLMWEVLPAEFIYSEIPNLRPGTDGWASEWLLWLYIDGTNQLASVPMFLIFGLPVIAAWSERRTAKRRWLWAEKLSFGIGSLLLLAWLAVICLDVYQRTLSVSELVDWILLPFTVLTILAVSWLLLRVWRRIAPAR